MESDSGARDNEIQLNRSDRERGATIDDRAPGLPRRVEGRGKAAPDSSPLAAEARPAYALLHANHPPCHRSTPHGKTQAARIMIRFARWLARPRARSVGKRSGSGVKVRMGCFTVF